MNWYTFSTSMWYFTISYVLNIFCANFLYPMGLIRYVYVCILARLYVVNYVNSYLLVDCLNLVQTLSIYHEKF